MQASVACFPHVYGVVKVRVQSHPNVAPTTISLKPESSLTSTKSSPKLTPGCKFQPQPLLNHCTSRSPRIRSSKVGPLHCGISSNGYSANEGRGFREWVEGVGAALSTEFPLWVTIGCVLGLLRPSSFNWVTPKLNIVGLTIIMLGMGMTLTLDDLHGALSMPKEVLYGFVLQYSVMPIFGFLVSKLLNLPSHCAAGLILDGCCPGGTASNIVTYLARGNVAFSVMMTAASTLSAVIMTPFLTAKLASKYVAVDASGLLISTLQVVLFPVVTGAFLNQYLQPLVKLVSPLMPPLAVATGQFYVELLLLGALQQSLCLVDK
ncbi:sodium/metabolite cotransporter BASS1 [Spatholobus suberectus]|nr:sodium/metabolite cotransporter BASS1 [Spatholobus suberectus]